MRNLAGATFNRLTVVSDEGQRKVPCLCACGAERVVDRYSLLRGETGSCGCFQREGAAERGRLRLKYPIHNGDRFARWVVLDASNRSAVLCRCDCGAERQVTGSNLVQGYSQSCGCLRDDRTTRMGKANRKHGLSKTPIYISWSQMMTRCTNPDAFDYQYYGARGISVHRPWHDVVTFAREVEAEIGLPADGMTLDRVNNDGNYEPGNIRWATRLAQARNRRYGVTPQRRASEVALRPVPGKRKKLTTGQVHDLLLALKDGYSQEQVARRFGVSQIHVSRIFRESYANANPSKP